MEKVDQETRSRGRTLVDVGSAKRSFWIRVESGYSYRRAAADVLLTSSHRGVAMVVDRISPFSIVRFTLCATEQSGIDAGLMAADLGLQMCGSGGGSRYCGGGWIPEAAYAEMLKMDRPTWCPHRLDNSIPWWPSTPLAASLKPKQKESPAKVDLQSPKVLFVAIQQHHDSDNKLESIGYIDKIRCLLKDDGVRASLNVPDTEGATVLKRAVKAEQYDTARLLMRAGSDPLAACPTATESVLFLMVSEARRDPCVLALLVWTLDHLNSKSRKEEAIAHLETDNSKLIVTLCGAELHPTWHGKFACERNGVLRLLLDYGVRPLSSKATHAAIKHRRLGILPLLFEKGADVDATDKGGRTLLHRACLKVDAALVRILLAAGADIERRTNVSHTPLSCAVIAGDVDIMDVLIDHGAHVDVRDKYGYTLLHAVVLEGNPEMVVALLRREASTAAKTHHSDDDPLLSDKTPIELAAVVGATSIARLICNFSLGNRPNK